METIRLIQHLLLACNFKRLYNHLVEDQKKKIIALYITKSEIANSWVAVFNLFIFSRHCLNGEREVEEISELVYK